MTKSNQTTRDDKRTTLAKYEPTIDGVERARQSHGLRRRAGGENWPPPPTDDGQVHVAGGQPRVAPQLTHQVPEEASAERNAGCLRRQKRQQQAEWND